MTRAEITAEMRKANDYLGYLAQQAAQLNQLAATSTDPAIRTALQAVHREKIRFERVKAQLAQMRPDEDRPTPKPQTSSFMDLSRSAKRAELARRERERERAFVERNKKRAAALRERERVARERDRLLALIAENEATGKALSKQNAASAVAQAAQLDAIVDLIDGGLGG